ncbi:MAG: short-chain dehydrogenase [Hydrocarboniphaga sp.]|uniref:SDR family NAD(P)-dependent oxidoreductase n=1 Tax=Hydrocarboniphaga sp. TaxID=2033016 RepID=UPI0026077AFE|nr:SDR family NAD(P)-dependent oxidoreductase [Hydrocarboniphaga sp.]MDB5972471.1 short-chain dehydrogenase [Hydrocarboniphaga sp.]
MQDLKGRVAFITGGASGIGLGIARACAEAGMKLMLADVDADALAAAQARLAATGYAAAVQILDVRDEAAWDAAAARAETLFGGVHLLCNNAGITGSGRPVEELEPAEWRRIIDTNLTGSFLGLRSLLPRMRRAGQGGHVVNTASMGALLPYAGGASYVASKAGMLALSEALRLELRGSAIGVSVLLPAQVRTRLFETSSQQLAPQDADAMSRRAAARHRLEYEGMEPLEVGRQVLDAIRENRFYVFTHPQLGAAVEQRFGAMIEAMR